MKNILNNSRVVFKKNQQKKFIDEVCKKLDLNLKQISQKFQISYSAIKKYRREELLIPFHVLKKLCTVSHIDINKMDFVELRKPNWGQVKGGKIGIKGLFAKYDEETINQWRRIGGKNSPIGKNIKQIKIPRKDEFLGEFIGIIIGDGTLTKYFVRISGDKRYDYHFLKTYVYNLVIKLFGIKPTIRFEGNKIYLRINSLNLCKFLNTSFNMPYGDKLKNNMIIPHSVSENKDIVIGCIRGLIDTDGSIAKDGKCLCIRFASYNNNLLDQVRKYGKQLNFISFASDIETGTRSFKKIIRYFKIIGSSNLKHIIRFKEKLENNKLLYVKDILDYYQKYKNTELPFRVRGPVG